MVHQKGTILIVSKSSLNNQVGGTSLIDVPMQVKVKDSFYDYETGVRYIGEVFTAKDIKTATEIGKTEFVPEDYKKHGDEMYQDVLKAFNAFNPKIIYFSEFNITKIVKLALVKAEKKLGGIIMERDFSVRKEIEVSLKENGLDFKVDDVLDIVELDELMMDMVELSIREALLEKIKENNLPSESMEAKVASVKSVIVLELMNRGII